MKKRIFEKLYHDYFALVKHVCRGYLGSDELAMDTAQDVYVSAWNNIDSLKPGHEKGFLLTIAKNKCLNILRHKSIGEKYGEYSQHRANLNMINLTALENSTGLIYKKDIERIIYKEIEKMPESINRTFCMRVYDGMSSKKIARVEGVSQRTIEYRLKRANTILNLKLDDYLK